MNTKAKGNRRERQTMELLESIGYECMRSAASLGPWDVVALHPTHVRLIQVKSNRPPSQTEREALEEIQAPPGTSREIWVWVDREKHPKVEVL